MSGKKKHSDDEARYTALKREAAGLGLIRRGSVVKRFMPCGKAGCKCQGKPPELHGPYYQWTRKIRGKTVTVRLAPSVVSFMEDWIGNGRQLDKIIGQLEKLSLRLTDRILAQLESGSERSKS